jgi:hypothetical protein
LGSEKDYSNGGWTVGSAQQRGEGVQHYGKILVMLGELRFGKKH